jgi:hypothetical protein
MDVALKTKEIGESKMGSTFIVAMAFETVVLAAIFAFIKSKPTRFISALSWVALCALLILVFYVKVIP